MISKERFIMDTIKKLDVLKRALTSENYRFTCKDGYSCKNNLIEDIDKCLTELKDISEKINNLEHELAIKDKALELAYKDVRHFQTQQFAFHLTTKEHYLDQAKNELESD